MARYGNRNKIGCKESLKRVDRSEPAAYSSRGQGRALGEIDEEIGFPRVVSGREDGEWLRRVELSRRSWPWLGNARIIREVGLWVSVRGDRSEDAKRWILVDESSWPVARGRVREAG